MHIRTSTIALAAAVSFSSAVLPANAKSVPQLVTATYSGKIVDDPSESIDTLGEFGPIGGSLAGDPFTLTFTANERNPNQAGHSDPAQSAYAGVLGVSFQMNGKSFQITTDPKSFSYMEESAFTVPYNSYDYQAIANKFVSITTSLGFTYTIIGDIGLPFTVQTPIDYHNYMLSGATWDPFPTGNGATSSASFIINSDSPAVLSSEFLEGSPDSLTVTSVKAPKLLSAAAGASFQAPIAAPEPAAWTTMLLGVGALGAIRRRHREVMAARALPLPLSA
jgi:MYXO-CTERM domain-containing protein